MSSPNTPPVPEVLSVKDLRNRLGCGSQAAYQVAREIGRRLGRRKFIVSKEAFEAWLKQGGSSSQVKGA